MKILIATGIYPPEEGGPATYSKLLNDELPKRDIEVDVLPFREVRHLPKVARHIVYTWKVFRRSRDVDIIFAQDPVSVGLPVCIVSFLMGKKFAIRVAGDYAWEQARQRFGVKDSIDDFQIKRYGLKTELLRKIQKGVVGRADIVITPSRYFKHLVSGWTKDPSRVHTIYNGIDFSDITEHKEPCEEKLIFSAGRLVPWKGFGAIIGLMKDMPEWKLEIAGDGPDRTVLEAKIRKNGLENRVKLLGSLSREELLKRLAGSCIFVLNTSFESFSFQVVEAMHAGVPIITTNVGSLPELIESQKEGILVEPDNEEQILSAFKKINSDQDFRNMIVRNAREKSERFSIKSTLDNLEKSFNSL